MRVARLAVVALVIAGCQGPAEPKNDTTPTAAKPDPYLTIRTRNLLDTTTATGRAHWHIYAILTGPNVQQNGVAFQGSISLEDIRLHHTQACSFIGADSIGTRLVSVVALGDTTTAELTADSTAARLANEWFAGDHDLPAGWRALFNSPADAWDSQQFANGHGRVPTDPIRWGLDWLGDGTVDFYERTDNGTECSP